MTSMITRLPQHSQSNGDRTNENGKQLDKLFLLPVLNTASIQSVFELILTFSAYNEFNTLGRVKNF